MALTINEEQRMLKTSAAELLKEKGPVGQLRQLRDNHDPLGYDKALWQTMADMGWTALTIPEAFGGLGFGYTGLGQVLEESGRTLTASPLVSTVLLSATAILLGGSRQQKKSLLPAIANGGLIMALAHEEGRHHQPNVVKTTASRYGRQFVITGQKNMVLDGHVAEKFIVVARISGRSTDRVGIQLFLVDADTPGVKTERVTMMDSRNAARVSFEEVAIPENALLPAEASGFGLLEKTLDIARIGLAAEMLGSLRECFERTIAYLKERQQFGVPIGRFQALQHRAAQMYCEIELCKAIVIKALKAIDEEQEDLPRLASLAKAKLGETFRTVSNEGIQMFGGIGMTDDEEIGFFLKRARVVQQTLGDTSYHLDRLARMKGI